MHCENRRFDGPNTPWFVEDCLTPELMNANFVYFLGLEPVHTGHVSTCVHTNLHANPLMLLASCVNTPIDHHSVFHNLPVCVVRCSASCVNWGGGRLFLSADEGTTGMLRTERLS